MVWLAAGVATLDPEGDRADAAAVLSRMITLYVFGRRS